LVLEDERLQLLTLRSQLSDIGQLAEFTQPEKALIFARTHRCDAAIIDIRMPRCPTDGIVFLQELREFDKDLAVIIRTGDESDRVADAAIELRAIKRALKSRITVAELRQATLSAIQETTDRRKAAADAGEVSASRARLSEILNEQALRSTSAELHAASMQKAKRELSSLSPLAAAARREAKATGNPRLIQQSGRCTELLGQLVNLVNASVDGLLLTNGECRTQASVNRCLLAVCQGQTAPAARGNDAIPGIATPLADDTFVACPPSALAKALRYLMDYIGTQPGPGLAVEIVHSGTALDQRVDRAHIALNRLTLSSPRRWVSFRASGNLGENTLGDVSDALCFGTATTPLGCLRFLGEVVSAR
jgi:DNA-binding NarL/FixJ family response regulator